MLAHELLHRIAERLPASRCVCITTDTTGKRAIRQLDAGRFTTFLSLQYSSHAGHTGQRRRCLSLEAVVDVLERTAPFELGFIDPFHSYAESRLAFDRCAGCTADGWLVVHDCYPPFELSSDTWQTGQWCGSTYAAFRDHAIMSGRAWLTIDDDFGLGILGPRGSSHLVRCDERPDLESAWSSASLDEKRELFRREGPTLFRLVAPEQAGAIVDSLVAGNEARVDVTPSASRAGRRHGSTAPDRFRWWRRQPRGC